MRRRALLVAAFSLAIAAAAGADDFASVTQSMLEKPSPDDWLMYSRTYDAQRYSPLDQIDRRNVASLGLAWTRVFDTGTTETVPLVHDGVMYVVVPGARVLALDAATGDTIWTYQRELPAEVGLIMGERTQNISLF